MLNKEMTMQNVIETYYALKSIIDDTNYNIDPLCKFKLLGIMKAFSNYVNDFNVVKNELIVKYGKETENGRYEIQKEDSETINKINRELEPVLKSKVTADISSLKPEDIFNKGIPAEYLTGLYEFVEA